MENKKKLKKFYSDIMIRFYLNSMLGHAYLVTRSLPDNTIEISRIKIGFFAGNDLENQVHNNYSRSLTPVVIYDYVPSHNARWAETTLHSALNKWRVNKKKEIFDLSSNNARLTYKKVKGYIIDIVKMSGMPKPMERAINYSYWLIAKKAANVGRKWNKQFVEIEEQKKLQAERERKKKEIDKIKKEKNKAIEYNKPKNVKKRQIENNKENKVIEYINKNLIYTGNSNDYVVKSKMYKALKNIYKEDYNNNILISNKEFFTMIKKILNVDNYKNTHKNNRYVFINWRYRTIE